MPIEITDISTSHSKCDYCKSIASTVNIIVRFKSETFELYKSFCLNCAVKFIKEQILPFFLLRNLQNVFIAENEKHYPEDIKYLVNQIKKHIEKSCHI